MSRHHFFAVALAAAAMASSVRAHSTFVFDMGPAASPVQSAYSQVTKSTLYAPPSQPFGWVSTTGLDDKTYASISPMIAHNGLRPDVLCDSVVTTGTMRNCTFKTDIPAGTYRCMVILGDVGFGGTVECDSGHTPLIHLSVSVDGDGGGFDSIASGLEARTLNTKFPVAPEHVVGSACKAAMTGGYLKLRFLVDVAPITGSISHLAIKFGCDGTEFSRVSVQGIELRKVEPMPITFSHNLGSSIPGLVLDESVEDEAAEDFVTAMNSGTVDVEALLDSIEDFQTSTAFERETKASALLWLAGWLDGSEEGLLEGDPQDDALTEAIDLLEDDALSGDNVAFELYDQALDFQLGVFHNRARGYTADALEDSLDDDSLGVDPIIANLGAGELLLRQIDGDLFASSDDARFEAPPLSPRATMLRALQYYARSPTTAPTTSPSPPNLANTWHSMIALMSSRTAFFAQCAELRMFVKLATYSALPNDWINAYLADVSPPNGALPTTYDPANTWWGPSVDISDDSLAPAWANAQHRALGPLADADGWWIDRRLLGAGELGGGAGDDVELVGSLMHVPRIYSPEDTYAMESQIELGYRRACDATLYGSSEVDIDQGYFDGTFGDVEHAAEFTTDPLFGLWTAKYGDPNSVEVPIRTLGNMLPTTPTSDGTEWTSVTASGPPASRRFRSYDFGADGVALGVKLDIPLNLRAISPAFALSDFNENEDSVAILDAVARAWRTDCMSTSEGKPAGIPPFSVHVADAQAGSFGTNGSAGNDWWTSNGYSESPQYIEYVYTLLLNAYRHSTATDREDFLDPILAAGEWMYDHRNDTPSTTAGTNGWILAQMRTYVLQALFDARRELYAAGLMSSSSTLTQHLNDQLAANAGPYARYVVSRHKSSLLGVHQMNADWLAYFWPIATSTVAYTDRAFLSLNGNQEAIFAELTGTVATSNPRPAVTWENPVPAQGKLAVAMLVAGADTADDVPLSSGEMRLLVYNFAATEQIVGFRVWHDLPFGNYTITYGPDVTGGPGSTPDDLPDSGTSTTLTNVSFEYRGQELSLDLGDAAGLAVPSHALYAVRLQYSSSNGASLLTGFPDVAVGRLDVVSGLVGDTSLVVRYHNLSTTATDVPVTVHVKSFATGSELGVEEGAALDGVTLGTPSSGTVTVTTSALPSTPIEIWLEFSRAQTTTINDHVILTLSSGS